MSGLFNFFGGDLEMSRRTPTLSASVGPTEKHAPVPGAPGGTPAKLFGSVGGKPRGLSIRSYSDLNINITSPSPSPIDKNSKRFDFPTPKRTQLDTFGLPVSPRSADRLLKARDLKSVSMEALSPRVKSPGTTQTRKLQGENIFKKPLPPKQTKHKEPVYPEPEKMAFYYEEEFFDVDEDTLDIADQTLIAAMSGALNIYEDEGFESDPETIEPPALTAITFDDEIADFEMLEQVQLPAITSDDESSDYDLEMDSSIGLPEILDNDF